MMSQIPDGSTMRQDMISRVYFPEDVPDTPPLRSFPVVAYLPYLFHSSVS